jgi:hypothetical protein
MQWERRGGEMNVDEEKVNRRSLLSVEGQWEMGRRKKSRGYSSTWHVYRVHTAP